MAVLWISCSSTVDYVHTLILLGDSTVDVQVPGMLGGNVQTHEIVDSRLNYYLHIVSCFTIRYYAIDVCRY